MGTLLIVVVANLLVLAALLHWLAPTESQQKEHRRR
jgi:hypothetical protein